MKKQLLLFVLCATAILLQQCVRVNKTSTAVDKNIATAPLNKVHEGEGEKEEGEDGIKEAQEMEFEITKDVALGYVPKDRLVTAYEKLMNDRLNASSGTTGTNGSAGPSGIAALTWSERGPNTDAIGPSNGNLRGTQAATDAVTSGRMRAVWVDIADATVWTGSVSGGLWHSTNIASSSSAVWSLVNDFFGNLSISSICQDPTNTNIMYFGTGEKTFNADAVRGGGIWQSTDHGVTWALMPGTTGYYNVSKVVCDASGNLYVATIGGNGILRYNKVAATWDNITPTGLLSFVTEMRLSTTGRMHIVCGYRNNGTSGLRFTDNPATVTSATWTSPTTTIPATLTTYNVELAVAGNTLYAECSNSSYLVGGIYKYMGCGYCSSGQYYDRCAGVV
jgi:trimeric autotransporter adhesin